MLPPAPAPAPAPAPVPPPPPVPIPVEALKCDDTLKANYKPDDQTRVTLVKQFKQGDDLNLDGTASGIKAAADLCMIKLNVGPGNPGPADAPSTSPGIGIEVWLPAQANWTQRLRVLGGAGFAGDKGIASLTTIGGMGAALVAGSEGSVSAATDAGHSSTAPLPLENGSFLMRPDGTINTALWTDLASRGIHQLAVNTRSLAAGFYLQAPKYAYWDGCSNGGRQGHMEAQLNPLDFDGILAGHSAISWTTLFTGDLYPQIVMQRDLAGVPITSDQWSLVSARAVSACDTSLTGQHDGHITNPAACKYDPAQDTLALCTANGGVNPTSSCLTSTQARAVNKIWYGQTRDGSVPAPATDIGYGPQLASNQLWYGLTRGTRHNAVAGSDNGTLVPSDLAAHQVALNLQNSKLATPSFINATGNGANDWRALSYAQLANASDQGLVLQASFANINASNPDLSAFKARGGKLLTYHGLADQLVPDSGTANYYQRAASAMGGFGELQKFYRYLEIPGMGHCAGVGSVNGVPLVSPAADPPLPAPNQLFNALTDWVEKGIAPDNVVLQNAAKSLNRPLCNYPAKLKYNGGDIKAAASYSCS